ncbi:MAG: YdcF family protein [Pseudomonadota bacterium]
MAPITSTIILVPGWYVGANGTCDLVSRRRVEGALALLKAHPAAMVVFSGGPNPLSVGRGREVSEARAMFAYALSLGLDPHRAWLEERARNTAQNRRYSEALVRQRVSGPTQWYVISSDFQSKRHEALFDGSRYRRVPVATQARSLRDLPAAALWLAYATLMEWIKARRLQRWQGRPATVP